MRKIIMMAAGAAVLSASPAFAATEDATMPVTANVLDSCTITASPMSFGTLTTLGSANIDSTSSVAILCTLGATYDVSMDAGANASGAQRQLVNSTDAAQLIPYGVFTDAARATDWNGTNTQAGVGTGAVQTLTAYGRIPASASSVTAGVYNDSVTVTVTF
ncbi:Csu type fimbrial protein [Pontixanthobacter sp.]|uniref:Csu type fimbrial protein n=1 Tax=Pontixanthobacter sp. TaxID=2792078 RepID=UPI003C7D3651